MRRTRNLLLLTLALLLATLGFLPGTARADGDGEFLPPIFWPIEAPAGGQPATSPLLMDRFPVWSYTFDGDGSYQTDSGRQLASHINTPMVYKAWALKGTVRLLHYPLHLQPGHLLAEELDKISGGFTSAFWQKDRAPWVTAALVLAGFVALWTGAWRGPGAGLYALGRTAGLLFVTLSLLLNVSPLLRSVDTVTGQLSLATFRAVNPAGEATLDQFGDALWQPFVLQPWIQGEFGSTTAANTYAADNIPGGQFLTLRASQRLQRFAQQFYQSNDPAFASWSMDYLQKRQVLSGSTAALALPVVAAGVLLSGGWLVYQILAALLLAGLPLLLLMALWLPEQGSHLLRRWALRLFSLIVAQMLLAFLLGAFVRLSLVAAAVPMGGWTGQTILLSLVAIAVLLGRREWLGLLALLTPGAAGAGWAGRMVSAVRTRMQPAASATEELRAHTLRPSLAALPMPAVDAYRSEAAPVYEPTTLRVHEQVTRQIVTSERSEAHAAAMQAIHGGAASAEMSEGVGRLTLPIPDLGSAAKADAPAGQDTTRAARDAVSQRALERLKADKK